MRATHAPVPLLVAGTPPPLGTGFPLSQVTLEQWEQLEVAEGLRCELVEGVPVWSPRPTLLHQFVADRIVAQLYNSYPVEWTPLSEPEVLVFAAKAPTTRNPDIVVLPTAICEQNLNRAQASDVLLAVEVLSPGTRGTDLVLKRHEYAKAGIEHYWIVDWEASEPTITALRRDGDQYHELSLERDGSGVRIAEPFPVTIDLSRLAKRR